MACFSEERPLISYFYVLLNALLFGNMFLFRASIGPISDVLSDEFGITSSGLSLLSSSYYWIYVPANMAWGLFMQIYVPEAASILAAFVLSIAPFLFPLIQYTSNPVLFGVMIRAICGGLTVQLFLSGCTLGAHRFGNKYVGLTTGFTVSVGTAHGVLGGVFQALMYEKYQDWESIYYVVSGLSLFYGTLFLLCKCKESGAKKQCDFRRITNRTNHDQNIDSNTADDTGNQRVPQHRSRGESISRKEAENMQLSVWKQTKLNLKQASKLPLNWIAGVIGCCAGIIFFGIYQLWFIPFLMVKYEYSRTLSSIVVGLGLAGSGVGLVAFGEIARRFESRKLPIFIGIAMYSSIAILIYIPDLPLGVVIALSVMIGIAFGCSIMLFVLGREYNWYYGAAETATGLINMVMLSSGFIGQYTIGALLDLHYQRRVGDDGDYDGMEEDESREYTASDYKFAFMVAPISVLLMFLLAVLLKETNGKNIDYDEEKEGKHPVGDISNQSPASTTVEI